MTDDLRTLAIARGSRRSGICFPVRLLLKLDADMIDKEPNENPRGSRRGDDAVFREDGVT
jgi:hypothetical protein